MQVLGATGISASFHLSMPPGSQGPLQIMRRDGHEHPSQFTNPGQFAVVRNYYTTSPRITFYI